MKDITAVQLCEVSCAPFPCLNIVFIRLSNSNLTYLIFGNTGLTNLNIVKMRFGFSIKPVAVVDLGEAKLSISL